MDTPECRDCQFFLRAGETNVGVCRRWPPQMLVTHELEELDQEAPQNYRWDTRFPVVFVDWWCGEWRVPAAEVQ